MVMEKQWTTFAQINQEEKRSESCELQTEVITYNNVPKCNFIVQKALAQFPKYVIQQLMIDLEQMAFTFCSDSIWNNVRILTH